MEDLAVPNSSQQGVASEIPIGGNIPHLEAEDVEVWQILYNLPNFRKDLKKLKAVNEFVVKKEIDLSLIKEELAYLQHHQESLISSFEISNKTKPYPVLENTFPPSSDGALYGTFVNGQFVRTNIAPIGGTWDFVMMTNGEIRVGRRHSWLAEGGKDVLAAGEIRINNGVIEEISNASGHYIPSVGNGMNYLRLLKEHGIDVSSAHLYLGEWDAAGNHISIRDVHPFAIYRSIYE